MAAEPKHNHGRRALCTPNCPRAGMSDGPCAICGEDSDPKCLVGTGGGNDYPVCSDKHGQAVWDALDAAQAAEEHGLPQPPWPIAYPPDWIQLDFPDGNLDDNKGTVEDLARWMAVPENKKALAAIRGE